MDGNTFKLIRLHTGMSQAAFAKYTGISKSTIAAIETGRREITDSTRARLAQKIEFDDRLVSFFEQYEKFKQDISS